MQDPASSPLNRALDSEPQRAAEAFRAEDSPIITFYSYKGGVGRSMALANLAVILARDYKLDVVVVDWDLEAPGLHRFFGLQDRDVSLGLIDFFYRYRERMQDKDIPFDESSLSVADFLRDVRQFGKAGGKVRLIPAGDLTDHALYARRVNEFDWNDLYRHWRGAQLIEMLRHQLKDEADVILIDSRTGITDVGSICTLQLPDIVILVFAFNDQNLHGIAAVARDLSGNNPILEQLNRKPEILLLPSRKELSEIALLRDWERTAAQTLEPFVTSERVRRRYGDDTLAYLRDASVQYVAYFAYGERLAVEIEEGVELRRSFETLAKTLIGDPKARLITTSKLNEVLKLHASWQSSSPSSRKRRVGRIGKQARLENYDLAELPAGANLDDAVLTGSKFEGAKLDKVRFQRADLRAATFAGARLQGAHLEEADLSATDFRQADLSGARMAGSILARADLTGAVLEGADLSRALGLSAQQLRGARLKGARLPEGLLDQGLVMEVGQLARRGLRLGLLLVIASVVVAAGALSTGDLNLLQNAGLLPFPSPIGFYLISPVLLLVLLARLKSYLERVGERVADLPAVFPDGSSVERAIGPLGLGGLFLPPGSASEVVRGSSTRRIARLALVWLAPALLLLLWARYLHRQDWIGTMLHAGALSLGITISTRLSWPSWWQTRLGGAFLRTWLQVLAPATTTVAILAVSWGAIYGVRPDLAYLRSTSTPPGEGLNALDPRLWVPRAFETFGYSVFADLHGARIKGMVLRGVSLQGADLRNVKSEGADLRGADLQGADLAGAQLPKVFLAGANLRYSRLANANLRGAVLREAQLQRSELDGAVLVGADLEHANLEEVSLKRAAASDARFAGASLSGADLRGADLSGAVGLNPKSIDSVITDETTQLPIYLRTRPGDGAQLR